MQTPFPQQQPLDLTEYASQMPVTETENVDQEEENTEPTCFHAHYEGGMEMNSDIETVAEYLNAHAGWFSRCAHPMKVEPLGEDSYILTIGCFGAFGYEVEPKIAVELTKPENNVYPMQNFPVPNYESPGYEVDYRAVMELSEIPRPKNQKDLPEKITQVKWTLDLGVDIQFPKFIRKLPQSLIQKTGDRLLSQIIRQVSRRLTQKVQEDFHRSHNLPLPAKKKNKKVEE